MGELDRPTENAITITNLRTLSPLRPPAWRWLRAEHRLTAGKRKTRSEDAAVLRAVDFQRKLKQCRSPRQSEKLAELDGPLHAGWMIWSEEPPSLRAELEARLLAGQSDEEIGTRMGLPSEAVNVYEATFFNVRDRLHCSSWVTHFALDVSPTEDQNAAVHNHWRRYAYHGGPHVLNALLEEPALIRPESPREVAAFFHQDLRQQLTVRAAMALRLLPLDDPKSTLQLLRLWFRFRQAELRLQRDLVPDHRIRPHLDAFCESTGWMTSLANRATDDRPSLEAAAADVVPFPMIDETYAPHGGARTAG